MNGLVRASASRARSAGQVLVMFVLFLLVLLGVSALAIDYASWLLTDRALQNVADHAALAGASQFEQRETQGDCGGSAAKCLDARVQAWASLNNDLGLGLSDTMVSCVAQLGDTPAQGEVDTSRVAAACTSEPEVDFRHTIWVTTPPPTYAAYTGVGGRYATNYGVVFVRVDREVRSFLGGALGITPEPRHGWATAGAIPTDFALQIFCRDAAEPYQNCRNDGLSVAGGGSGVSGIHLIRGDIGSNESLQTTSQQNRGVIVEAGNVFLVNGSCAPSTWNCPVAPATTGGIADADPTVVAGANMKNAFYMAPLPVPQFASPVTGTVSSSTCAGASSTALCIPDKGIYECFDPLGGAAPRCGIPTVDTTTGTVSCVGVDGGTPGLHFYADGVADGNNRITTDAMHPQSNTTKYYNIAPDAVNTGSPDDDYVNGDGDTLNPPAVTPNDWVYISNLNISGSGVRTQTSSFTIDLDEAGNRAAGVSTVRYTVFKTNAGIPDDTGYVVKLTVSLRGTVTAPIIDAERTLTGTPTQYEFTVNYNQITSYNGLQLRFEFSSMDVNNDALERGGGVAWAGVQHPEPQPPTPPMIPPGYYQGIEIADDGCAVLDPTAEYSGLLDWQMPGIYRFGRNDSNNTRLQLGAGAYLVGDGVTFVFDAPCAQVTGGASCWPDDGGTGQRGLVLGPDSGLLLNTATTPNPAGVTPCTPYEEFGPTNLSAPLSDLPFSAVCAAWAYDPSFTSGVRPGQNAWHACDPDPATWDSLARCVERSSYSPVQDFRGITFYFTPAAWPPSNISNRFEMQGGSSGLAFRGVLYAPYDDVGISGKNGFDTVGQVLAWTAKFHGGGATIDLDYPYEPANAKPYLLEPTVCLGPNNQFSCQ